MAVQCLISAFQLSSSQLNDSSLPDLATLMNNAAAATSSKPSNDSSSSINRVLAEKFKTQGNEFVAKKDATSAITCYTKAIEQDPTNAVYYCNRAAAYFMQNDYFRVVEDAKKSIELNPAYSKAYHRLGRAHLALGEPEEAVAVFEKALELEPKDAVIRASLEEARRAACGEDSLEAAFGSTPANPLAAGAGGAGMPAGLDFAAMLNDPNMMKMAQDMVNSGAMDKILRDPNAKDMMKNVMSNPDIMRNFMKNHGVPK